MRGPLLVVVALALVALPAGSWARKLRNSDEYDFFFFVRQWPGTFCTEHACPLLKHRDWARFTIHGLWPNRRDGTWPEFCDQNQPFDEDEVHDLEPTLDEVWPSFMDGSSNANFWAHEWNKHGTCALRELGREHAFFKSVVALNSRYDLRGALERAGITPSRTAYSKAEVVAAIRRTFGVDVLVHCDQEARLTEVWMCFTKSLMPMDCEVPASEQHRCEHVTIGPFPHGRGGADLVTSGAASDVQPADHLPQEGWGALPAELPHTTTDITTSSGADDHADSHGEDHHDSHLDYYYYYEHDGDDDKDDEDHDEHHHHHHNKHKGMSEHHDDDEHDDEHHHHHKHKLHDHHHHHDDDDDEEHKGKHKEEEEEEHKSKHKEEEEDEVVVPQLAAAVATAGDAGTSAGSTDDKAAAAAAGGDDPGSQGQADNGESAGSSGRPLQPHPAARLLCISSSVALLAGLVLVTLASSWARRAALAVQDNEEQGGEGGAAGRGHRLVTTTQATG